MSWIWWLLISGCAVLLGYGIVRRTSATYRAFPPGPPRYPIIGHLHLLSRGILHQNLAALSRTYGPILGLGLGLQSAVVVSSPALAKQVLSTHDQVLSDRPPSFFSNLLLPDDILFSRRTPQWRTRRKLCLTHLFTQRRLRQQQQVRQEELAALLQTLHDASRAVGGGVDIHRAVGKMSEAIILRLICSHPTAPGEDLQMLIEESQKLSFFSVGDFVPWLSFLDVCHRRCVRRVCDRLDQIITAILLRRKQEISRGEVQHDDLLHVLLSREVGNQLTPTQETLTSSEITSIIKDMLGAGIHTTATTIEWAMAELMRNPKCFNRLQQELDEAVDTKQVTDDHVPRLPYLKCVVKEVFRLHPVVQLLLPRISTAKCRLDDYIIPPNTLIFVNVWSIGRDKQVWSDQVGQFLPERFEEQEIDVKGHDYELLPFGSGRRGCLGLSLGLSLVQVTLANLIKSFNWELPSSETPESINMEEAKQGVAPGKACPMFLFPKPRR